ncbi:ComEC/Rec2 family competence protein [Sedimentibacter saalensis]|uniref:Beta-lactamase superfamily II metal-dependent hydrolase n=1 Tax=Sedimentibacter saalensis TaxID=130788 RepID=A0A562JLH0_9FIRM|nr:MBL fold metallo-hydrolase [Sedimentibacter saalensis]TWH83584.1 beta-lactamase superfamily II metal-dependent hydrolase [Sedimentibacter saalensis]
MKSTKRNILILFLALMTYVLASCGVNAEQVSNTSQETSNTSDKNSGLIVYFLDVGQADCTLIQLPNGEEVLIDAGNYGDGSYIKNYLENLNVDDIEYFILTHPHEDHIGSAKEIINNFTVKKIYMPDVLASSNLYESTMLAIENKDIETIFAKPGLKIIDSPGLKLELLSPKSMYYSELNEYSAVARLEYDNTSFLFTGDAESVSELEMLGGGFNLDSDVLKVGHHGGRTSSSIDFLKAVTPEYSIISCGEDNSYGHPHIETLNRLSDIGSDIYRTDELGTIVAVSNGKDISITSDEVMEIPLAPLEILNTPPIPDSSEVKETPVISETNYVGNKNSLVFHKTDCSSVADMKESNKVFFTIRQNAVDQGYTPCGRCNP